MTSFDSRFAGRLFASSALALLLATPAFAADPEPAKTAAPDDQKTNADGSLNEVIVTAEKRPQSLQKTPIAISVLSAEDLQNRHVQSLVDLQDGAIPSLRVAPFYSRNSALIMNIRGIGVLADSNQPARDQGVASISTACIWAAPRGWAPRSMISRASRCSRVRRARCSAAIPRAARSAS